MKLGESLRSGFKSLLHNKVRSFLTMLGIIIGIFSVIMLTSIGEGVKEQVTSQVEALGANLLYVLPGKVEIGHQNRKSKLGVQQSGFGQAQSNLSYDDVLALKNREYIKGVTGIYNGVDRLDDLDIMVSTTGTDEDLKQISELELRHGRFINKKEREEKARVAVIGHQANKEIFGDINPVGRNFTLNGEEYKVIGVLKYKKPENMGPRGEDLNVKIYLPITEIMDRSENQRLSQIIVRAKSSGQVDDAQKLIIQTLSKVYKEEEFTVLKQQDMLNAINNILSILTAGLGGIAAISLLVGGIGIMNIMLVSVTERTREIGVRKAIGASRRDILIQFLIEAIFISLVGGMLGLAAGVGGARFLPRMVPAIQTAISPEAVLVAIVFAVLVGVFFGVYPASKASRLDPIEALRSE